MLVIGLGIVPDRPVGRSLDLSEPRTPFSNTLDGEDVELLPFLDHCSADERQLPVRGKRYAWGDEIDELEERYRCPPAWYKKINYERGQIGAARKTRRPRRLAKDDFRKKSQKRSTGWTRKRLRR
jgi:hypothetical protein